MSKLDLFDNQLQVTAITFKAFAHPARLAILNLLAKENACLAGKVAEKLPLGRTTINQHLKELKEVGLITAVYKGNKIIYSLNNHHLQKAKETIDNFMDTVS